MPSGCIVCNSRIQKLFFLSLIFFPTWIVVNVINFGSDTDDSVDYPDYAKKIINAIEQNKINIGILICGTGIGMSICANRNKHIRAALCLNTEYAKLAREHNDANVLVLGARYISFEKARNIVNTFLDSKFQNGRHLSRINKINLIKTLVSKIIS